MSGFVADSRPASRWLLAWMLCWTAAWTLFPHTAAFAQPEAAPAPAAVPVADPPPSAASQESMLSWIVRTSGWIGAIILALSIYLVASITKNFFDIRELTILPPELAEECTQLIEARDFAKLYQRTREDESYLGQVLTAGLSELRHGIGEAREATDRSSDMQVAEMDRRISMIAVIGTLGPMIGLLGTLKGMIASFSVIAMSDSQIPPSKVAGGISEALLLTFEGVGLSIPAIFFFALFRNRITAYTSQANALADRLLRRILEASRGKGAAEPPPMPAAPAAPAANA